MISGKKVRSASWPGVVFLAEYLDRSFRDPEDLKQFTSLPVLAAIPLTLTAAEEQRQRLRRRLLFTTSAVIPVAALAAVHLFWVKIDLVFARTWQLLKPKSYVCTNPFLGLKRSPLTSPLTRATCT